MKAMGIVDLVVFALVTLCFQLSTSYRLNRNQPDLSIGDFNRDYDMVGWKPPTFSDYSSDDDLSGSSNNKLSANRNVLIQEFNRELKTRQAQNDIRQLLNQFKQVKYDNIPEQPSRSNYKLTANKRQSGAQICIWKVCPPSPWRRSGGKK